MEYSSCSTIKKIIDDVESSEIEDNGTKNH